MMIAIPRRIVATVLSFCTALPVFAQDAGSGAKPIAVQMYSLRNVASLEDQLKIVHDAGVCRELFKRQMRIPPHHPTYVKGLAHTHPIGE